MTLKSKIENNIFTILTGIIIATAGTTYKVHEYYVTQNSDIITQRHIDEISDLSSTLASIKRNMGGKAYLDVRTIQLDKNLSFDVPQHSKFFSDDSFYATENLNSWKYIQTTEGELISWIIGQAIPPQLNALTNNKIHLWRSEEDLKVKNIVGFKTLFPFVFVQRFPVSNLASLFGSTVDMIGKENGEDLASTSDEGMETLDRLENIFRGDMVGNLFFGQLTLNFQAALVSPQLSTELVEVQKVGNVLYAQFLFTLKNVSINNKTHKRFYLRKEIIILSTQTDAYLIATLVPSSDPSTRHKSFSQLTEWFDGLRILI